MSLTFKMGGQDQPEKGLEGEGCFLKRDAPVWVYGKAGPGFCSSDPRKGVHLPHEGF